MKEENGHLFFDNKKEFRKWINELDSNIRVAYIGVSNSYSSHYWYLVNGNLSCYVWIEEVISEFKLSFEQKCIIGFLFVICMILATILLLENFIIIC